MAKNLEQALYEDLSGAQESFKEIQQERGVQAPQQEATFREKGIRLRGRIIAKDTFQQVSDLQTRYIEELGKHATFANELEKQRFGEMMEDRLNTARRSLLRTTLRTDMRLAREQVDYEKRQRVAKFWGSLASSGIRAALNMVGLKK